MTNEQAAWLRENPAYAPIGVAGGTARWTKRGTLKADGTFVGATRANPLPNPSDRSGAFGVGVLEVGGDQGRAVNPNDPALQSTVTAPGLRRGAKTVGDQPMGDESAPSNPRDYVDNWQGGNRNLRRQT
jgi:hypothetical protein